MWFIINKQKHQIDNNLLRQDQYFSTRLPYANKKIREIYYFMVNTTYISTQELINKIQNLKGKTNLIFFKKIGNLTKWILEDNGNFQFEEDPLSKNVQSIGKYYHEVLLLMKFLQTKPQVKNMKIIYFDLYYTVIKARDNNEVVNDK